MRPLASRKGNSMWNWTFEASAEGRVSLPAIWKIWTDVSSWPEWDTELEWSQLDGPFFPGTLGSLKPNNWSPLKFTISEVVVNKEFKDVTTMPFGTILEFHHLAESIDHKNSRIIHRVHCKGRLAPILRLTLRRKLKKKMPGALIKLIEKAGEVQ